jgi:hypothetical protein
MRIVTGVLLILLLGSGAHAQFGIGLLTYDISIPAGELEEYIGKTSWRGIGFEARKFMNPKTSVGLLWHWNSFDEVADEPASWDNIYVEFPQDRFVYAMPIMASLHYYLYRVKERPKLLPYVGIGIGTYWIERQMNIPPGKFESSNWHFGLAGEIGGMFLFYRQTATLITLKYNYAFERRDAPSYGYWGINIGFAYTP